MIKRVEFLCEEAHTSDVSKSDKTVSNETESDESAEDGH